MNYNIEQGQLTEQGLFNFNYWNTLIQQLLDKVSEQNVAEFLSDYFVLAAQSDMKWFIVFLNNSDKEYLYKIFEQYFNILKKIKYVPDLEDYVYENFDCGDFDVDYVDVERFINDKFINKLSGRLSITNTYYVSDGTMLAITQLSLTYQHQAHSI
jgi:hypothetical protein